MVSADFSDSGRPLWRLGHLHDLVFYQNTEPICLLLTSVSFVIFSKRRLWCLYQRCCWRLQRKCRLCKCCQHQLLAFVQMLGLPRRFLKTAGLSAPIAGLFASLHLCIFASSLFNLVFIDTTICRSMNPTVLFTTDFDCQ